MTGVFLSGPWDVWQDWQPPKADKIRQGKGPCEGRFQDDAY